MSRVKARGNKSTEIAFLKSMRRFGIKGWRRHFQIRIDGCRINPDFVFQKKRLAVFLDGCFWHCCPVHGSFPSSNVEFWKQKLERNTARDNRNNILLKSHGWSVVRIWEHQLKSDPDICVKEIIKFVE